MDIITQKAHHRKRMVKYYEKHGGPKTAIRYRASRTTVYKWVPRYDGTIESLKDRSRRPRNSPREHTEAEKALIKRVVKRLKWRDLILAYQLLVNRGYSRSYGGFKRIVQKLKAEKPKKVKPKKKPKPYQRADFPGQKIQIDVKYVPSRCVTNGQKYYQYTAKDECTRWTYREMYDENSSYSAHKFLMKLIKSAPFPICKVQTDNGTEFTNALMVIKSKHKTLFEQALMDMGIEYQRIRIATPRHNGKVERQHRTDEMRFYDNMKMYSLEDGRRQLAEYQRKSNNIIMTCLNMESPNQVLAKYLGIM
jgi:transposase